jgi:hypothetical protein
MTAGGQEVLGADLHDQKGLRKSPRQRNGVEHCQWSSSPKGGNRQWHDAVTARRSSGG